jgi:hypothetical protein
LSGVRSGSIVLRAVLIRPSSVPAPVCFASARPWPFPRLQHPSARCTPNSLCSGSGPMNRGISALTSEDMTRGYEGRFASPKR